MPVKTPEMAGQQPTHGTHEMHTYTPPSMQIPTNTRQSSSSIKSTVESLNDFLDLYADDDESGGLEMEDNEREDESDIETSSVISHHPELDADIVLGSSNVSNGAEHAEPMNGDIADRPHQIPQPQGQASNDSTKRPNISPYSMQSSTFKVIDSSVKTTILHTDSTIISDLDTTIVNDTVTSIPNNNYNTSINLINRPRTYTYTFDEESDDDSLGIDESILEMINNLGNGMDPDEELEIEFSPEVLDQLERSKTTRQKSVSNSTLNNIDLLSIEMSSEDEDYDDANRFKFFFGIDSIPSSNSIDMDQYDASEADSVNNNEEIQGLGETPGTAENETGEHDTVEHSGETNMLFKRQIIEGSSFDTEADIHNLNISPAPAFTDFDHNTSLDLNNLPEDPPPYCEIDELQIEQSQQNDSTLTVQSITVEEQEETRDQVADLASPPATSETASVITTSLLRKKSVKSTTPASPTPPGSSSAASSPLKRKISIKLKKNKNGELSRHASVDFYHMDRYLPPYRSLINPNKVFDYRTNTYIDANDNDIEIKAGDDNKPIVAIHKKKRDSKFMTILLTTNNNIKQKLLDATTDSSISIKSRSVSIRSLASITHSIKSEEMKSKPVAKFNDLPKDIHRMIIDKIDNQHDLVNCLYVSREFNEYTVPNLYEFPKFTSSYRLAQFVYTIMNYPEYSQYVKVFDLSNITFPVSLTKAEISKYQNKLVYGSNTARELLNDKTKIVYAGWRDWKYRSHPLYGDFNKWRRRANSSSTISSSTSSNNLGIGMHWDTNKSAPNLLDLKKLSSTTTLTSSTGPTSTSRTRSHSGSGNTLKRGPRGRSNSASNVKPKSNSNTAKTKQQADDGKLFKSFKKAFGIEPELANGKKKRNGTSPVRKAANKGTSTATAAPLTEKKKSIPAAAPAKAVSSTTGADISAGGSTGHSRRVSIDSRHFHKNQQEEPFGTPHPKMNNLLKQYCFRKDIPAGYIMHVLNECEFLEEVNFNNIVVSTDYELRDYESFDWFEGTGRAISNYSSSPVVLDAKKPIFWSDSNRDMDMSEAAFLKGFAEHVDFKSIWKCLSLSKNIRVLKLEKLNSLEKSIIEEFVMNSEFKDHLQYLDCCKSGMVKRKEWDHLKVVNDWRKYFLSKPT